MSDGPAAADRQTTQGRTGQYRFHAGSDAIASQRLCPDSSPTVECPALGRGVLNRCNPKSYSRAQLMDKLQGNDRNSKQQASFLYVIFYDVRIRRDYKEEANSRNHHKGGKLQRGRK